MNSEFTAGQKVTYFPNHGNTEKGIIKRLHPDSESAWVVYNCAGNWAEYENYTAALTNFRDLQSGWNDDMKFILIQNDCEIELNSFELIGASTKRNQEGKIGFFGSGLKYSIAFMMRNNIAFNIYSGETELLFTLKPEELRGQTFQRIMINDKPTSYTTSMGPTWTEDWFVVREIYCNAIDEAGCQVVKCTDIVQASAGKTRIYIQLTPKLQEVITNWDQYFTDERTPLFQTDKVYTSYLGNNDGNSDREQTVTVYQHTSGCLYRRGIKVYGHVRQLFDYELQHININEDRTATDTTALSYMFACMAGMFCNEDWIKAVLKSGSTENVSLEFASMGDYEGFTANQAWVQFSRNNLLVIAEISGKFIEEIQNSKKPFYLIPSRFARHLKKQLPEVAIMGMGGVLGDIFFTEITPDAKISYILKSVIEKLQEMQYLIEYPITIVNFGNDAIMGRADMENKVIFISEVAFSKGTREVALTLMEEQEHINTGFEDKTRNFQSHLFSKWLTALEDKAGCFF